MTSPGTTTGTTGTTGSTGAAGTTGNALETAGLGKRYGGTWALRDCTFTLPAGRVGALVGPNGAGKTTLLHLATGLLEPSAGTVRVFGRSPREHPKEVLPHIGFVAQDHPLYGGFTVAEMHRLGRALNLRWDDDAARSRVERLRIPLGRRIRKLSGGQQAQVALGMALAKRPELVLLDEPLASLDPLARREFLRTLMDAVREQRLTVLLSSHIITDLERVCDYLILLSASRVQVAADIGEILRTHALLTVPQEDVAGAGASHTILEREIGGRLVRLLVRLGSSPLAPGWQVEAASLEAIVLAYLGQPALGDAEAVVAGAVQGDRDSMEVAR
jgi:ABC-2 type transport system ATP-binding protein